MHPPVLYAYYSTASLHETTVGRDAPAEDAVPSQASAGASEGDNLPGRTEELLVTAAASCCGGTTRHQKEPTELWKISGES